MRGSPAEETLGYVLIGVFFSLWLSGIISSQTLGFYTNYPNERKWLKVFVGFLVLVDVGQTVMGVSIIWDILIRHFNDPNAVRESTRVFQLYPVLVGLISSSVQIFFAWRIKALSGHVVAFALIVVLAIPQFAGGIAYTILTIKVGYFEEFWNFNNVIIGWVASSILCDIVITATLTMILRQHRVNQNLGAVADLVRRIKKIGIHNGLVTVIWSIALLIALAAAKQGAHYMFFYPLGKVYLITMIASLNSRPVVRPELDPRIHSLLQRNSSPRFSSLDLPRGSFSQGEKIGTPLPRTPGHTRSASRTVEYLPSSQAKGEDEQPLRDQRDRRRSDESIDEGHPLVGLPQLTNSPPPLDSTTSFSRPRGPRGLTSPSLV